MSKTIFCKKYKWDNYIQIHKNIKVVTRDKIKDNYCKENNIPLIKIPYWEYDMMDSYIINELKKIA